MIDAYLKDLPLIAILRGIKPNEIISVGVALAKAGFTIIEIPMNSVEPLVSIRILQAELGESYLIGAGTVTSAAWVPQIADAGGRIIVMPHADLEVIRAAKTAGLYCVPGIATPSEGFSALANGADALKLFPAELITPTILKAMRSVFPKETLFMPVGGITPGNMRSFLAAGASGFGLGSALYKPGMSADDVTINAQAFVKGWRDLV